MAITEQQVIAAAERIQARGDRPTNERIRSELGEGSYSTINKHMKAWRSEQADAPVVATGANAEPASDGGVPDEIAGEAGRLADALVARVWQLSETENQLRIGAERSALQSEVWKIQQERERHDDEIAQLEAALERTEREYERRVEQLRDEISSLEMKISNLEHVREDAARTAAELAGERERRERAEAQVDALMRSHDNSGPNGGGSAPAAAGGAFSVDDGSDEPEQVE